MQEIYQPAEVERVAQDYWQEHGSFKAVEDAARERFYCL